MGEKISLPPAFDPRVVQPVASCWKKEANWNYCRAGFYIHEVPVIWNDDDLQRGSHKPYGPPTSVMWQLLLRKQKNTGISTALTADTRWSTRTQFRALVTSA
jgi:hypothetical protein